MPTAAFQTMEQFHGKQNVGSTNIRVHQLLKYWPEAQLYRYGMLVDVLILQKVYLLPDYQFPAHYPGKKVLDICDADWLEGSLVKQTIDAMDAVTCPTEALANFLRQLTDKPVVVIPDRYDLELFPEPKVHSGDAKTVVWYGYRHNAETIKPALDLILSLGLNLLVISDDDPMAWQWYPRLIGEEFRRNRYQFVKHSNDPVELHKDIQKADFAVLPFGSRPVDVFKSNNKTIRAILCGLPVAKDADEVRTFVKEENRKSFMDEHYEKTKKDYDCKESVNQYKSLINQLIDPK